MLLYGRRLPVRLKVSVYKSYVRPAMLYQSEAWCLKESMVQILRRTERSMVWSAAQRQKKIYRFDVHVGLEGNYR